MRPFVSSFRRTILWSLCGSPHEVLKHRLEFDPAPDGTAFAALEFDPASLNPSSIRMRGAGFFIPCAVNNAAQVSRGTASTRTGRPRTFEKIAAPSFGVIRRGPSNWTIRRPVHFS
jgi:hypothetical protein